MNEPQNLLEHLEKVENKASEILTDRQEIIALDKRRNDDRVAMRALQKQSHDKRWITVGPLLLKMPSKTAEELLEKGKLYNLINGLRNLFMFNKKKKTSTFYNNNRLYYRSTRM